VNVCKIFLLRGVKDSPPYLHDGRLMTLDDSVEFFNVVLSTKLTKQEKSAIVAFMRCLRAYLLPVTRLRSSIFAALR
jgi:cytochrome c peroxidase